MPQFTKGKWYAGKEDRYGPYVYAVNGKAVNGKEDTIIAIIRSSTYNSDQFSDDEVIAIKKANARLIAEAPVMYNLLNKAFHAMADANINEDLRLEIDECLSRVDGEENLLMTLDEAIQHSIDIAQSSCGACAKNHRQLAEWLIELKNLKNRKRD